MRFLVTLLITLLASAAIAAEMPEATHVERVSVEGTRRFGPDEVMSWMVTRPGRPIRTKTVADDARRVLSRYEDEGYWHTRVRVDGPDGEGILRFFVEEGDPTVVDSVIVTGQTVFPAALARSHLSVRRGSVLVAEDLHADLENLLRLFERGGYPYASIHPAVSIGRESPTARVELTVDPGPRVTIDGIRFSGLAGTNRRVLQRTTGLKIGDPYDRRAVDGATRALRGLPYLASVEDAELEQDVRTGRYWLHFHVEEMPSTRIEGVLGLLPGSNRGHRVSGLVNAEALNLLGTGRQLSLHWQRPDPLSSDLRFHYREPYLADLPLDATVMVAMGERTGYAESRFEGGLRYHPVPGMRVSVSGGRAAVRPDSLGLGVIDDRSAWVTSMGIGLDRVDNEWHPRRGYRFDTMLSWDRWSESAGLTRTDRLRANVDGMALHPVGGQHVVMISLHGRGVWQRGGPTADAWWRLGGAQSIRGYVEEQFLADAAGWARLEWRKLMGPRARVFAFSDAGMLRGTDGDWFSLLGYGVGIQSTVRSGDVRVEYALSKDDAPSRGKVHVRLISTF